MIELDVGVDFRAQALDQLLVAVLDRIQADIAVDIHHEVLQRIQPVGVVAFGRDIRARHHLEEALGGGIVDLLVEHFLAGHVGPGMLVVVRADAFVIFDRRHHVGAALAERLDRGGGLRAVFAAHARHVVEQLAVELHLLGVHRYRLQAEMLDQFPQRIRAGHRIIVDFGDAGLVHRRRGIEFARDDLAADAVGRLVDRDAAEIAELFLQIPGAHQPARAAAYDCKIQHVFSVAPPVAPCLREAAGLNHTSKSAFHPEGKMNKAGPRNAAMKESSKKAGLCRPFVFAPYSCGSLIPPANGPSGSASAAKPWVAA